MFTMSAREFNQSVAKAQRIADEEPVLVTRHGQPAYVLLSVAEYEGLRTATSSDGGGAPYSLLKLLSPPEGVEFDDDDDFDEILRDIRKNTPDRPPFEFD